MRKIDVSPIEIRDYALSYGYTLVKDGLKDGLFVLNSPENNYKQLIFPVDPNNSDFLPLADLTISKISNKLDKSFFKIVEEIREVNDDVISLRYYSDTKIVNSLSFQEALESIEATKQMILSAGSSVVNPVLYHPRLSRAEATELLRKTRFRHTEEGSFILKVSCPIQLESAPIQSNLFGTENEASPISRKAFELINESAYKLLNTVEVDNFAEFLEEQQNLDKPIISYNFCDSIVNLFDDERELPFELKFNWSRAYQNKLPTPQLPSVVKFPYSFKPKFEELKSYFQPDHKETTDTFFGTVESLNGNIGDDGKRFGEIILALIIEGQIVNARVILNSELYDIAYRAHGKGGGIVRVKGKLTPGKRIRTLDEVSQFESVEK